MTVPAEPGASGNGVSGADGSFTPETPSQGPTAFDPDVDMPVRLRAFRANVRRCKYAMGFGLAAAIATGATHTAQLKLPHPFAPFGTPIQALSAWRWMLDVLALVLTVCSVVLFLTTLRYRPFPAKLRPADLGQLDNIGLHRLACVFIFFQCAITIVLHATPGIVYTYVTHRKPPHVNKTSLYAGRAHVAALVFTFIAVGCMRRGPKLRAHQPVLGSDFGVRNGQDKSLDEGKAQLEDWDDDIAGLEHKVIDYGNSSMLTFLSLGYSASLARRSFQVDELKQNDLPILEEWVRTSGNEYLQDIAPKGDEFHPVTNMGIVRTLWKGRGWTVFNTFVLETLNTVIGFVSIGAVNQLIAWFGSGDDKAYGYLMCWAILLGQVTEVVLSAYLWVRENYLLHNPVRMTISAILFTKILRSTDAKAMEAQHLQSPDGEKAKKGRSQIMNLLTIDTGTVASLATYMWKVTNGLVRFIIGLYFLVTLLGWSAIVGLMCIPLVTPVSVWIAKKIYQCDREWARARDARTGAIKEFLSGFKVIKLNAFEDYEIRRIGALRDTEVMWQRWRYTLGTLFNIVADQVPNLPVVVMFIWDTKVMGHRLEPATAFVTLGVFLRVKSGLDSFTAALDIYFNSKIALDRLRGYLNQPEVVLEKRNISEGQIIFDNVSLTWPTGENRDEQQLDQSTRQMFYMRNLNFSLPVGRMTLVCGPLGAGKTLFLRAMLGEASIQEGRLISPRSPPDLVPLDSSLIKFRWTEALWLDNSVAYAPQLPYIRHGTVRDNIVFGQPFWQERYDEVLRQCSLIPDLKLLVDGDLTEVGEHGINLSGGQKARINLARCLYSRARTIYLDDPLSAVDAHTSQYLVDECFRGSLLEDRTVVLVSHHVDLCLPCADFVVSINEGRIEQACPASEAKVASLVALSSPVAFKEEPLPPMSPTNEASAFSPVLDTLALEEPNASGFENPPRDDVESLVDDEQAEQTVTTGETRTLYKAEHSSKGHVERSHYWLMMKNAGGLTYWVIFVVLYVGTELAKLLSKKVLEWWSGDNEADHLDHYIWLFIWVNVLNAVAGGVRWVWLYGVGDVGWYSGATKKIHRQLLSTICNAPLSFFETTPSARLLNIFAQDIKRLDSAAADAFGRAFKEIIQFALTWVIVIAQEPLMLVVMLALGIPLFIATNKMGSLRADIRRLAAVADSPLIGLYHDAIDGVVIYRAFGMPNVMTQAMKALLNRARTAEAWNWIIYNWVRAFVLATSSLFVAATALLMVKRDSLSSAAAGFVLIVATQLPYDLFELMEQYIQLEQTFVSAERVNYYLENTPPEPKAGISPSEAWPEKGAINIRNLSFRYAPDLPDVLHDISLDIKPGQRVGLVGATGSGKSTLALSLFRGVEARKGSIKIDGIDISTLKLHDLRSRLNMVVQDGSLPSGTLRNALDISGERDDVEIYHALRRVHLLPENVTEETVEGNPFANLDTFVAAEGLNFSHGQRQLLCLARALLKKSKILVMDEATSSVDFEMDAKITATIKEAFEDTTILTIAHRLATIVAFDRVVVLNRGQVVEFDRPLTLMKKKNSAFYGLCMAQGEEEFAKLLALAQAGK